MIDERPLLKNFNTLGLAEPLLRAIAAEGYTTPTPIQQEVIPALLADEDVLGIAQTGTGKTAAFVLPLLHRFSELAARPQGGTCRALILTPTRELASQIAANIKAYGQFTKVTAVEIVGGVKPGPQIRALKNGADIVVATPGRLEDHVRTGVLKLNDISAIVLDEADQMLDLGFAPSIRRIISKLPRDRQTILLSATMPKQIHKLATDLLTNPVEISVTPVSRPIERIDQTVLAIDAAAKRDALIRYVSDTEIDRAIVFTRTKRGADKVKKFLVNAGHEAEAIHGNKSQGQRERALGAFRKGNTRILVATDIAARGIDVDDISHVINFDLPEVAEVYVHRIGRTARAGKSGIALSLCAPPEDGLLKAIEKLIKTQIKTDDQRTEGQTEAPVRKATSQPQRKPAAKRKRRVRQQVGNATGNTGNGKNKRNRGPELPTAGLDRILSNRAKRPDTRPR